MKPINANSQISVDFVTPNLSDERFSEKTFEQTKQASPENSRTSIINYEQKFTSKSKQILILDPPKIPKPTTFDALYKTIKRPIIDMFTSSGDFTASYRMDCLRQFVHNDVSQNLELELSKISQTQNAQQLLLTLSNTLITVSDKLTDPVKYVLCFYKGVGEYMLDNLESSNQAYKHCYNLYDGDPQLYYNMGLLKMKYFFIISIDRCKQFQYAIECFSMCSSLNPAHPFVTNNLAYIYILLGKNDEATHCCKLAFATNPKANNYFRNWAIALLNLGKLNHAVDIIKRGIEANQIDHSIFHF